MQKMPITCEGYKKLQEQLDHLKEDVKPSIIKAIAQARELGDLSENAEYHEARKEQSFVEGKILNLENQLVKAEIINISELSGDTVKFGATVTIENQDDDSVIMYQIVSDCESDISKKKISIYSPIGSSLISKSVGDYVNVILPSGEKTFKILNVEFK